MLISKKYPAAEALHIAAKSTFFKPAPQPEPRRHRLFFEGHWRIATGTLQENALAVKRAIEGKTTDPVLIFDDRTGRSVDVDIRGTEADVKARLAAAENFNSSLSEPISDQPKGPGRPKLGVVSREVATAPALGIVGGAARRCLSNPT